jgi:HD-like signal output (HDOD) protein
MAAMAASIAQEELISRLQRAFASPGYKPPLLPAAAVEVLQLAQGAEVTFERVVTVLERDPVLTARVVSVAQSAAYSGRSPIQTLPQAAVRLGVKGMRDLVLQAALDLKVFRAPGYDQAMARLARHSSATAHVVRAVCQRTGIEAEQAFLCGLLHDVGFAAATIVLAEDPALRRTPFERLAPAIQAVHLEASGMLAWHWHLHASIQEMVSTHHAVAVQGRPAPLNAALIVAEQLAWEAGAGLAPPPEGADPAAAETPAPPDGALDANPAAVVEEARAVLGLDAATLRGLREQAFELVRNLG